MRNDVRPLRSAVVEPVETRLLMAASDAGGAALVDPGPAPVTIAATDASYVRGGGRAKQNFGTDSTLVVKDARNPGSARQAYIRFDLAGLGVAPIEHAKLRLFGHRGGVGAGAAAANGVVTTNVFTASDDAWDEAGLTWKTKPEAAATPIASLSVGSMAGQFYEVDLTSFLQTERAAGHTTITLVLKNATPARGQTIFASDEATNGPQLIIARPAAVNRFEISTFNATPEFSTDHFTQGLFDHLNVLSPFGGYHFGLGSDVHRNEVVAAGNTLAVYYNTLTNLYDGPDTSPEVSAATIDAYVRTLFTSTGSAPKWVVLNEISGSLWPSNATYRAWLIDTTARLHDFFGYEVIVYSPFGAPAANDASWQLLAQHAYIGVEQYLSGEEVKAHDFSVEWAQSVYQNSKSTYMARGVPADRIFLGEHFGQTVPGTGWGRAGVSADDWIHVIQVRDQAIYNVDFAGFLSFAWGKNGLQVSDAELASFEDAHMSQRVLHAEGS